MVLGDFNSIMDQKDGKSLKLDSTSPQLLSILKSHYLVELEGVQHQCFTYHHPSLADCKSRLDRIYVNYVSPCLWGYSQHVSFSDHYLVGLCLRHPADVGPCPWHFPVDMLEDSDYCAQIDLILAWFDRNNPLESWETIKLCPFSLNHWAPTSRNDCTTTRTDSRTLAER